MTTIATPDELADLNAAPLSRLDDQDLELLLMIRHLELTLLDLFAQGMLHGTTHTCLGQEYVPVSLRTLIGEGDVIFSNHRGHGHYLARFADPTGLLAEIMGREGAICHGVGGSQHLLRDGFLSTGVQGESLPVAVGVAVHLRRTAPGRLAAAYIGDGTWGEGVVYEALNLASLWSLPLLVIVENNGIAQTTPTATHMAGSIADRCRAFGIRHERVDSLDVAVIREQLAPLIAHVRTHPAPLALEFITSRLGPHSKGDDTREPRLLAALAKRDWYFRYATMFPDQFHALDQRQRARISTIAAELARAPLATWEPS